MYRHRIHKMPGVQEIGGIEKHRAQQLTVTKTSGAGARHIYIHTRQKNNVDTLE